MQDSGLSFLGYTSQIQKCWISGLVAPKNNFRVAMIAAYFPFLDAASEK